MLHKISIREQKIEQIYFFNGSKLKNDFLVESK